jgi:TetR/AcrR family transcriptional regulator, cholesterol catabolism regulator
MEPKDRILKKADELFNRYGIRSVSMDDIASQLGMSKKTVYQYYADKDELVTDVFTGIMECNKHRCTEGHEQSENALHEVFLSFDWVQEMFANMNPAVLFEMEKYHPGCFKKFKEHQNGFMYHMLKSNIERGMNEGIYREDLDVDILTRYRIHSILLAFDPEVFPGNRHNIIYIERQLLEVFLNGIATSKGHKLIQKYLNQRTKK